MRREDALYAQSSSIQDRHHIPVLMLGIVCDERMHFMLKVAVY